MVSPINPITERSRIRNEWTLFERELALRPCVQREGFLVSVRKLVERDRKHAAQPLAAQSSEQLVQPR